VKAFINVDRERVSILKNGSRTGYAVEPQSDKCSRMCGMPVLSLGVVLNATLTVQPLSLQQCIIAYQLYHKNCFMPNAATRAGQSSLHTLMKVMWYTNLKKWPKVKKHWSREVWAESVKAVMTSQMNFTSHVVLHGEAGPITDQLLFTENPSTSLSRHITRLDDKYQVNPSCISCQKLWQRPWQICHRVSLNNIYFTQQGNKAQYRWLWTLLATTGGIHWQ